MDLTNKRLWLWLAVGLLAIYTIYSFAAGDDKKTATTPATIDELEGTARPARAAALSANRRAGKGAAAPGAVQPIRMELLDPRTGSYSSRRNLFAFTEPPPPPVVKVALPAPLPAPILPPDKDKDGVPDVQDNCPGTPNPDQADIDRNGTGAACQEGVEIPPPPPPPTPPDFTYKFIGTFGTASRQIAAFSSGEEIINVRVGQTFGGKFILLNIGIESVDVGFVGFPADIRKRIPVGQ